MITFLASCILMGQAAPTAPSSWVSRPHTIQIGKDTVAYQATAGFLPVEAAKGAAKANMFFSAYTVPGEPNRPVTFVWNGGPGGSSILLHMYCVGPRNLVSEANDPKKFHIQDNPDTLLRDTDLVLMDPVGTGFSKATSGDGKAFYGVEGDIRATVQFIHAYLDQTGRAKSPVFLAGESYGTFRAAGVAKPLLSDGVDLRGLILLSNAIRFDTFVGRADNDLPFDVFLPTLTATAAFHKKLKPDWNQHPEKAIAAAEDFAGGDYLLALAKGDSISKRERHKAAQTLSELTSLPVDYIESKNLRIDSDDFRYKLFPGQGKHLGKFDGNETGDLDIPSAAGVKAFVDYLKDEIGFQTEDKYIPLSMGANMVWDYGRPILGGPDQSDNLRSAMEKFPNLRLFVAQGLYDLTTPFYGERYSFNHLGLSDAVKDHWEFHTYEGGHMMYLIPASHDKLKAEATDFIQKCLKISPAKG